MKSEAMHIVVIGNDVAGNTACSAIIEKERLSGIFSKIVRLDTAERYSIRN